MAGDFQTRIEDIIGSVGDTQLITNSLTDAASEFINMVPAELLWSVSTETADKTTNGYSVSNVKILDVRKENGTDGEYVSCKEVPLNYERKVQDPNSLFYPSSQEPIFFRKAGGIYVYGGTAVGSSPNAFKVVEISYPAVAFGDSSVAAFPDEWEYIIVLGASIKCRLRQLADKRGSLPSTLDLSSTITLPSVPSVPVFSYSDASATNISAQTVSISGTAPTYTKPVFSAPSLTSIGTMTLPEVPVASPTTAQILTITGTAPTYTSPTTTISGVLWATEYPSQASAITTAIALVKAELDETQAVCDDINADLVRARTEIGLAKAEAAELATNTDNSGSFGTACNAINTELDKVDNIIAEASAEFDKVDNVIVEGSVEIDKSSTLLDLGEADSEGAINTAAGKIITELDETQVVCDLVNTQVGSAVTALSNMATEIALANKEVDDALIEIDEAVGLTDGAGSNIQVALDAMKTANAKFRADGSDPALFGDDSTYDTSNSAMTSVKTYVDRAISYINGNFPAGTYDLAANLADVDAELTSEDIELASARVQQAQTTMSAVQTDLQIAQIYITEWNTMVQTLVAEVNAFSTEASDRYGWINAKAVVWQGELSAAQGYMATANGYNSQASGFNAAAQGYATEVQTKIGIANGYVAEINIRLQQANTKRQESASRLAAGNAYIQEANAIANQGNAYIQEAQTYIAQAQGYAAEVNARSSFVGSKSQAVQGYISTAQNYVAAATGYGNEVQTKIGIAQGYSSEIQSRLSLVPPKVSEYQVRMTDALNTFNDANVEYQAKLNKDVQDVTMSDREEGRKLQKYQQDVSKYQAEVNKEVQRFINEEFNVKIQEWQTEYSQRIASYNADMQNELNEFNKENIEYQAKLQSDILDAQNAQRAAESDAQLETDVDKQNKLQDLQKQIQEYTISLQRYSSEVQSYSAEINGKVQEYANNIQRYTSEHSLMAQELQALQAQYNQSIQILIGEKK